MLLALALPALADSPLTSTDFSSAYGDVALVQEAKGKGALDTALASRLAGPMPLDEKAAVVNALGWTFEGKHDADVFARALAARDHAKLAKVKRGEGLRAEDALVLGYLVAMDDYFHPDKAFGLLAKARAGLPKSRTVATVDALVHAQKDMETDFCKAWADYAAVKGDATLAQDLRPGAVAVVDEYMSLYADGCPAR
jgi:hypothetical protein